MHTNRPFLVLAALAFAGCASGPQLDAHWSDPQLGAGYLRGARVLVINALFRVTHPSHLSIQEALDVARKIGADRTYLTHLTHDNFHADLEAELPPGVSPAFDGLAVTV